ncbi:MAG: UDP-N-acetylmuramoyl-L-alanine--D-glutamate ligase [Ruthenibacterium sp.]
MTDKIADFYKNLQGKKVAFIGTGVTNQTCIELFAKHGAVITLCDKKPEVAAFGKLAAPLQALGIAFSLGEHYLDGLKGQDMVMRTPGFEYFTPELQAAKAAGAEVTSEMELFFTLCPCKIVAITGSDGKTTTSTLIAKMLEAGGYTVHLGGNLGRALLPVAEYMAESDLAVVELSSFQLISMRHSPDIAVVTNVSPNHLDHHKDMQEYVDAKRNILLYQMPPCKAVLGYANEITRGMKQDVKGTMQWFTRFSTVDNGGFLREDGMLCMAENGTVTPILHKKDLALRGEHNIENMLAAFCAVWTLVTPQKMAEVAQTFAGVEHRIEPVRKLNGVQWYNDSIATSPTRVIAGLRALGQEQKLIIIAGGSDKGISFTPMVPDLLAYVKTLILTGATAAKIEAAVRENADFAASGMQILHANGMEEAVQLAAQMAKSGDIVSLSPACASFDSYANFEVRGNHYKTLVNAL